MKSYELEIVHIEDVEMYESMEEREKVRQDYKNQIEEAQKILEKAENDFKKISVDKIDEYRFSVTVDLEDNDKCNRLIQTIVNRLEHDLWLDVVEVYYNDYKEA